MKTSKSTQPLTSVFATRRQNAAPRWTVTTALVLVLTTLSSACNLRSPTSPGQAVDQLPGSTTANQSDEIASIRLRSLQDHSITVDVTDIEGNIFIVSAALGSGASELMVNGKAVCDPPQACAAETSVPQSSALAAVLVAAVALALAVEGAWDFWRNCVSVARTEKARNGDVSWATVGSCYYQGAVILAGGRLGKYLEGRRMKNVRQTIETALRMAVPDRQLHTLFNSTNLSTTAGVAADIAAKIIDALIKGFYKLITRS